MGCFDHLRFPAFIEKNLFKLNFQNLMLHFILIHLASKSEHLTTILIQQISSFRQKRWFDKLGFPESQGTKVIEFNFASYSDKFRFRN